MHGDLSGYTAVQKEAQVIYHPQRAYLQTMMAAMKTADGGRSCSSIIARRASPFPSIRSWGARTSAARHWPSCSARRRRRPPRRADPVSAALAGLAPQATAGDRFKEARRPAEALALLGELLQAPPARERLAIILDYGDYLVPPADKAMLSPDDRTVLVTLLAWAADPMLAEQGNLVFLCAEQLEDLHPDLCASGSGWKAIAIPPPDRQERLHYLAWCQRPDGGDPCPCVIWIWASWPR